MKRLMFALCITLLLSGCAGSIRNPFYVEPKDDCQRENQRWIGHALDDQAIVGSLTVMLSSCPNSTFYQHNAKLELFVHNGTQAPIQTNIFSDKLRLSAKNNSVHEIDLTANTNHGGEIINPGSVGLYKLEISDKQIYGLFSSNQVAFINFKIGFNQKTIMLLRADEPAPNT